MQYKTILAVLAFSTAALGAAKPPPAYNTPSSSSADPCTPSTTTVTTTRAKKTVTVTPTCPTCPTTKCTKSTVTSTITSTETANQTIISTITQVSSTTVTATATPGPVVELIAYHQRSCGVMTAANGNQPNFQGIHLTLNTATGSSQCQKITQQNPQSFSWDVISFADVPASCHLYFYFGDSCFDDNGGSQQISLNNGANACHNLPANIKSVRLFC